MFTKKSTENRTAFSISLLIVLTGLVMALLINVLTLDSAFGSTDCGDSFSLAVYKPAKIVGNTIPNQRVYFMVKVSQNGIPQAHIVNLHTEIEGDNPSAWRVNLNDDKVIFLPSPGARTNYVLLTVKAGAKVEEGDSLRVNVIGVNGEEEQSTVVRITMDSYNPSLKLTQYVDWTREEPEKVCFGESLTYDLTLANLGQERDNIMVSADVPQGWGVMITDESGQGKEGETSATFDLPGEAILPSRNMVDIKLTLTPPPAWPKNATTEITVTAKSLSAGAEESSPVKLTAVKGGLLVTASDVTGPWAHPHNLNPGSKTTYPLQITNIFDEAKNVELSLDGTIPTGWWCNLSSPSGIPIQPGQKAEGRLEICAPQEAAPGSGFTIGVVATTSTGEQDRVDVSCRVSQKKKVYFVTVDALAYEYLDLNRVGTGMGSDGDWLMPNIRAFMEKGSSYSETFVHLPSATDMNHLTNISGSMSGTTGLHSVAAYYYGRNEDGHMIIKDPSHDSIRWGEQGEPVLTMFDVAKDPAYGGEPGAFNAAISGKGWVMELMQDPDGVLDRKAHGQCVPFYLDKPYQYIMGDPPSDEDAASDPNFKYPLGHIIGARPGMFPDDRWVMEGALKMIENEDPDVLYIIMAEMDDGHHMMGAGWDLDEWLDQGTESTWDDISRINPLACRECILDTAREADYNFGLFLDFMEHRGTLDDSYIILTADHGHVTHYVKGVDYKDILDRKGITEGENYATIAGSSAGFIYDAGPDTAARIEEILEKVKRYNRMAERRENPFIVINRDEMLTGVDTYTGEVVTDPDELYNIWYAEFPVEDNSKLRWPNLYVFARENWQIPVYGGELFNLGLKVDISFPELPLLVGGHGGPETQHIPLIMSGPGIKAGYVNDTDRIMNSMFAPTIYQLNGWSSPANVDGEPILSCMEGGEE